MKFRVKYLPFQGYYAQVKLRWYRRWKTIGPSPSFVLRSGDTIKHPLDSRDKAKQRCFDYRECVRGPEVQYEDLLIDGKKYDISK